MKEKLIELISRSPNKQITYADYIEAVLYDTENGYYMKQREKVGRQGDFITTSNIGNVYGQVVARWFYKLVNTGVVPAVFCEIGAGTGRFARAFLDEWSLLTSDPITYYVLESSPYHKQSIKQMLEGNIKFIESFHDLQGFYGLLFSNELFDAFPVHVIENRNSTLYEVMVTVKDEQFKEELVPLTNEKVISYISDYRNTIREQQRMEVPIAMSDFIKNLANVIESGIVVTVDYGYTDKEWLEPSRIQGSLRGYINHQMKTNILSQPGEMDITSHVQWDPFIQIGEKHGLKFESFMRQDQFFLDIGILDMLKDHFDPNPFSEQSKQNRAIRSLITPGGLSSHFQVVIQTKHLTNKVTL